MDLAETLPCLILDVTDCEDWASHPPGGTVVPAGKRPTVLQTTRKTAEGEALRLARRNPGRCFLVLEARVIAKAVEVPTHVTLAGHVFARRQMPVLMDVIPTGEFPPF